MRIGIIACLLILLTEHKPMFSQAIYDISIPDSIIPIDILKDADGFVQILGKHGIYQLNGNSLELKSDQKIPLKTKNYADSYVFENARGGFVELGPDGSFLEHELFIENSVLHRSSNEDYLLFDDHIYVLNSEKCELKHEHQFDSDYSIWKFQNDYILLNEDASVYIYSLKDGIRKLGAIEIASEIQFAKLIDGSLYLVDDAQVLKHNVSREGITFESASEINIVDPAIDLIELDGKIILITASEIVHINTEGSSTVYLDQELLDLNENLVLTKHGKSSYWLLQTNSLKLFSDIKFQEIKSLESSEHQPYQYTIRNKNYISDGKKVYRKSEPDAEWNLDASKQAPYKVITPVDGHPVLFFDTHLMRIHKDNALILDWISQGDHGKFNHFVQLENGFLLANDTELYMLDLTGVQKLQEFNDRIIELIELEDQQIIITESVIYIFQDLGIRSQIKTKAKLQRCFRHSDKLICLGEDARITILDLTEFENYPLKLKSSGIRDLLLEGTKLILLNENSLSIYSLEGEDELNANFEMFLPLSNISSVIQLIDYDSGAITLASQNTIYEVEIPDRSYLETPKLKLEVEKDKGLQIIHSNLWTDNIRFNYMLSGKEKNESIWTSEPFLPSEIYENDYESVVVQMSDELFGKSIASKTFKLPIKPKSIPFMFYIIGLMIIFASAFGGLRLLKA